MSTWKITRPIVVTGVDGSGKSTLISRLCEHPDGPRLAPFHGHDGGPPFNFGEAYERMTRYQEQGAGIRDRCCLIDEPVYQRAIDRPEVVPETKLDEWLVNYNPVVIYCQVFPGFEKMSTESKAHKGEAFRQRVADNLEAIREQYVRRIIYLCNELRLDVVPYNWRVQGISYLLEELTGADALIPATAIN